MSVPRVILQSRLAIFRGSTTRRATDSILRLASTGAPQRQFSSSVRIQEDLVQTPATGPEVPLTATRAAAPGNNAQSVAIMKLPWNTVPAEVEQLFRNAGVDVKRLQIRVERFTFQCDTCAFVELGSKGQVQKAIKALNGQQFNKRTLKVTQLSETFYWESGFKKNQRFFFHDANTPSQAIQGLLEGRRYRLYVENPGWIAQKGEGKSINAKRREIINKAFEPFNVETLGGMNPVWKSDRRGDRTFMTHIEFATKEDAQRAVDALNDTVIEGRRVELRPHTIIPRRAEQIGKVDKSLLVPLQEHGLLTIEDGPNSL